MQKVSRGPYAIFFKRLLDILCSLAVIVLLCWLYAIIAVMVRVKLGTPVLFRQERPGRIDPGTGEEKIFRLCKFRTMTDERDENGELLPDSERLTSFGSWLRSTSLDEIPELFNILKGDMSLVGPRPLLVEYLPWYTEEERARHLVRPGLTGWAQVNGRNNLDWDQRLETDVYYVKHISFVFDLKILILTVKKVFVREDIAEDTRTVEPNFAEQRREQKERMMR